MNRLNVLKVGSDYFDITQFKHIRVVKLENSDSEDGKEQKGFIQVKNGVLIIHTIIDYTIKNKINAILAIQDKDDWF